MPSPINIDWTKVDQPELVFQRFPSRRSQVYGTKGIVSSSQPLATAAGLEILSKGGNAGEQHRYHFAQWTTHASHEMLADAAVATSAALNVTEPSSCGIGG
jgi:gamma-glutamyltranspeptidase/glutathione hydrolase